MEKKTRAEGSDGRLTSVTRGGGCACKLSAAELRSAIQGLMSHPASRHPDLLVGFDTADDAGVWRLSDDVVLVHTVDFFTPVVDDPYDWGRITAANALSDIYAMGATPLTALQLLGWPRALLESEAVAAVLQGGLDVMAEAGCVVVGGHSIDSPEPVYGFAVTGSAHPGVVVTNAGARPGDRLILTKPLGTGIVTTAIKRDQAPAEALSAAIGVMTTLNRTASEVMVSVGASSATDVTGFGLLGHLREMLIASRVGAVIDASSVPMLPGVETLADAGLFPAGSQRNLDDAADYTDFDQVALAIRRVLADAQTSGGLLIAAPTNEAQQLMDVLREDGSVAAMIGELVSGQPTITVAGSR